MLNTDLIGVFKKKKKQFDMSHCTRDITLS